MLGSGGGDALAAGRAGDGDRAGPGQGFAGADAVGVTLLGPPACPYWYWPSDDTAASMVPGSVGVAPGGVTAPFTTTLPSWETTIECPEPSVPPSPPVGCVPAGVSDPLLARL
jgi:hypothetical protein